MQKLNEYLKHYLGADVDGIAGTVVLTKKTLHAVLEIEPYKTDIVIESGATLRVQGFGPLGPQNLGCSNTLEIREMGSCIEGKIKIYVVLEDLVNCTESVFPR